MATNPSFVQFVTELLSVIGPVDQRKMFGGHGLFLEGLMFGLIADNTLYLKTDAQSEQPYIELDLEQFSYQKRNKTCYLNYRQAPEMILEDAEQARVWGNLAYETALRAQARKRK